MVGKGQPPKDPADVKKPYDVFLSQKQIDKIEQAKAIEAPEKRLGAYIRDAAMQHVEKVLTIKALDDMLDAKGIEGRRLENKD